MQEDLKKALEVLESGGSILYPTDTIWGMGCDATNARAISKIYKIKFRKMEKSLILLANSIEMIRDYVEKVPDIAVELIDSYKGPLTLIYDNARNLPKNLIPDNGTIAIRIPKHEFCLHLINQLGKPITSTSANLSGDVTPISFSRIQKSIIDSVDYVCKTDQGIFQTAKPSTIIKVSEDGNMQIIRS